MMLTVTVCCKQCYTVMFIHMRALQALPQSSGLALMEGEQQAVKTLDGQGRLDHNVTAARRLLSKAVYCIDNYNNNRSAE